MQFIFFEFIFLGTDNLYFYLLVTPMAKREKTSKETVISYQQAVEIIKSELIKIDSIKDFCEKNDISYYTTTRLGNSTKEYPNQVSKILKLLGYKVTTLKTTQFKLS